MQRNDSCSVKKEIQTRTAKIQTLCAINDIPFPSSHTSHDLLAFFFHVLDLLPTHHNPHDLRTILGELDQVLDLL
jgi:hypothetical protein